MSDKSKKIIKALRWAARILGTLLFLLVLVFAIGEGVPNPSTLSLQERGMFLAWGLCLIGYLVAWRWERLATGMILGGMAAFYIMNYMEGGKFPGGIFPLFFLPGLLLLACGWNGLKTKRPTACGD